MLTMTYAGPAGSLGYYLQGLAGAPDVMALQNALNAAGFNAGTADGVAVPKTNAAVIDFVIKAAAVAGQFTQVISQVPSEVKTALEALLTTDTWLRNNTKDIPLLGSTGLSTAIRNADTVTLAMRAAKSALLIPPGSWVPRAGDFVKVIDKALEHIATVQNGMNDLVSKHASKLTQAVGVYTALTGGGGGAGGGGGGDFWYQPPATVQPPINPTLIKSVTALRLKTPAPPVPGGAYQPTPAPSPTKYPAGSIYRFNVTRGVYSVYAPMSAGLSGGYPYLMGGLGADPVVEPPAPGPKVGETPSEAEARDGGASPGGTEQDRPFYKSPWFIGGAIAVVAAGAGGYVLLRRKRSTTL